jgi:hypothetical protein
LTQKPFVLSAPRSAANRSTNGCSPFDTRLFEKLTRAIKANGILGNQGLCFRPATRYLAVTGGRKQTASSIVGAKATRVTKPERGRK